MVVRDEQRFLRENLTYHRRLGVTRTYLFLDRCTDDTARIAAELPDVTVLDRPRRDDEVYMSSFQTRCLAEALGRARDEAFDWLLHLDADEFARGDDPHPRWLPRLGQPPTPPSGESIDRARLTRLLADVSRDIRQVVLRPMDVLPTPVPPGTLFHHHIHFQNRGALTRSILDPTTGQTVRFTKRLGHYHGKAIVRVTDDVRPGNAHRFVDLDGHELPTIHRGLLYHYIAVDGDLWHDKHRKFAEYPAHWEKGTPVRFPKQAWKEASLIMNRDEARRYFDRYVALPPSRLDRARWTAAVVRDPFVHHLIEADQTDP